MLLRVLPEMTFYMFLTAMQLLIGGFMVILILLQRGKGAETGAAFGSGASATVFGAKGSANFLSRSTAVLAALFFANSLALTYLGAERPVVKSLIEQTEPAAPALQPVQEDNGPASTPGPVMPAAPPGGGPAPATAP
jgi:preprotein translocase subunit SecG